jgi:hypothetical protein
LILWVLRGAAASVLALAAVALASIFGSSPQAGTVAGQEPRPLYWTWDRLEPDTVASAWLLQRFAQPGCEIRLVSRGQMLEQGTAFDIPLCDLARTRTRSTFHVLCDLFGASDPRVLAVRDLIDEIELGHWERLASEPAADLDRRLREVIAAADDSPSALAAGFELLDRFAAGAERKEP